MGCWFNIFPKQIGVSFCCYEYFAAFINYFYKHLLEVIFCSFSGISYRTHPRATPICVTDFHCIEKITTSVLHEQSVLDDKDTDASIFQCKKTDPQCSVSSNEYPSNLCNCNDIKALLRIKVAGNLDDLTITCNGFKAADSIADLVDGYCRIVKKTDKSCWVRFAHARAETDSFQTICQQASTHRSSSDQIENTPNSLQESICYTENCKSRYIITIIIIIFDFVLLHK